MASLGFDLAKDKDFLYIAYRNEVESGTIDPQKTTWEKYYTENIAKVIAKKYGYPEDDFRRMVEDTTTMLLKQYTNLVSTKWIDPRVTPWKSWYYFQMADWLEMPETEIREIGIIRQILKTVDL